MAGVSIRRTHALPEAVARERVQHVGDRLAERFGARCTWQGDRLAIEHDSVRGHIALEPGAVSVEATLGGGLGFFRGAIESEIARVLERELST